MRPSPTILCLCAVMAASATDSQPIRVDVNLVNVAFSVYNAHGKLAGDLSQDDFEVLEDGVPQRVSFFARSLEVPLSLGLVADVSASQRSFNEGHRHDLKEFLKDVLAPRDQAFLVCFGNRMQLVGDFTASGKSLMDAFEWFENGGSRYPLGGGTALFDAVYYAVTAKLAAVEGGGKALILFSDGQNNDSAHNMRETIEAAQTADTRVVAATEPGMSAFVFKIQANMDPNHRDRIAFVRLCCGKLSRGMKVKQVRTGKTITLHAPQFFFAQDRALAEEAFAGDVVGIPNHGTLRIGDTLTEGEELNFAGVPNFAPEILRRVRLTDAMRAKKLKQALHQLAEEGVAQVFQPTDGSSALVGVVGPLQLDVLKVRLADEYGLEIGWSTAEFQFARWLAADDRKRLDQFAASYRSSIAEDFDGDLVFLARNAFDLEYTGEHNPGISFTDVKDIHRRKLAG